NMTQRAVARIHASSGVVEPLKQNGTAASRRPSPGFRRINYRMTIAVHRASLTAYTSRKPTFLPSTSSGRSLGPEGPPSRPCKSVPE
ncbi:hypothetical protein ACHAPS_006026, partial [Verticillium nonalfalfae]